MIRKGKREKGCWEAKEVFGKLKTNLMNLVRQVYYLSKRAWVPKRMESFPWHHLLTKHSLRTFPVPGSVSSAGAVTVKRKWSCSVMCDSETPWTVAYQAPPSMGFSRQEYWSGLPFPSPGNLPDPGIEPLVSRIPGRRFLTSEPPGKRV